MINLNLTDCQILLPFRIEPKNVKVRSTPRWNRFGQWYHWEISPKCFSKVIHSGHSEGAASFSGLEIYITINMSQGRLEGTKVFASWAFLVFWPVWPVD